MLIVDLSSDNRLESGNMQSLEDTEARPHGTRSWMS